MAAAASAFATWVFALGLILALAVILTSWRALLPRKAWEDPSVVQINRLPTHSRLRNYPTFEEAATRVRLSPNVVDLRYAQVVYVVAVLMLDYQASFTNDCSGVGVGPWLEAVCTFCAVFLCGGGALLLSCTECVK